MKGICIFFLVFFLVFSSNAQLLWEITGNGIKNKSYLYGTIHVMPKDKFSLSPAIQHAFKNSSALALEVKLNMSIAKQFKIAKMTFLPEGKTLKNYLSASDYSRIKLYCLDSVKMSESKFSKYIHLKPFFFSAVLAQEQMGETASYEIEFNKLAKKQHKKRLGLESIEFQLETVNKISIEDQAKMLMSEFGANPSTQFDEMLSMYLNEDLNGLYKAVTEETNDIPEFNQNFLVVRNANWIPVIEKQIAKKSTFIAVGAAHLPGEKGVIHLLRAKGYQVTPVR